MCYISDKAEFNHHKPNRTMNIYAKSCTYTFHLFALILAVVGLFVFKGFSQLLHLKKYPVAPFHPQETYEPSREEAEL